MGCFFFFFCFCSLFFFWVAFLHTVYGNIWRVRQRQIFKKEERVAHRRVYLLRKFLQFWPSVHMWVCLLLMAVSVLLIRGRALKLSLVCMHLQFHPMEWELSGADRCHGVIISVLLACKDSPKCSTSFGCFFMRVFSADEKGDVVIGK